MRQSLRRMLGLKDEPTIVLHATRPIEINPADTKRIHQARYRLDAISRYIEQTPNISREKMREFRHETFELVALLDKVGVLTEYETALALKKVNQ